MSPPFVDGGTADKSESSTVLCIIHLHYVQQINLYIVLRSKTLIRMVHRAGWQSCTLLVVEHFPLIDAGESELVRGSRSGQGPHEVKPSYLRVLALLFVLLLSMFHPTPSLPVPAVCALILCCLKSVQDYRSVKPR